MATRYTSPKTAAKKARREARKAARRKAREQASASLVTRDDERGPSRQQPSYAPVLPLNDRQRSYAQAIGSSRITLGIGPAGTGKTYFAAITAANALYRGDVERIVLTRPNVEAGEKMGALPGELDDKYEPYLRPFKDALVEFFGDGHLEYLLRKKVIEAVPIGFMRGRTIKNAVLLADEMQNATLEQIKMLLTRIGEGSTFVLNGDPTQADIRNSGLARAIDILAGVEGISIVRFTRADIVRDDIVARVLEAFEGSVGEAGNGERAEAGLLRFMGIDA